MALLSLEKRKQYFKDIGLEYNEATIKALQRKYMWRKSDVDGVYGPNTDNMVRSVRNTLKFTKNFDPKEFRCECGGKYCCGFPSWMKKVELQNLQSIRTHYGKPMTVTCGLRCKGYNKKLKGSITNSKHLTGYATDFYMKGVTDTLANRKAAIKWIKKLPNHNYTYGNGINSNGVAVRAAYMGNALHTDTNKPKTTTNKKTVPATAPAPAPIKSRQQMAADFAVKIANDNSYHYVKWKGDNKKTQKCCICHGYTGSYKGFNCIRFAFTCWYHGGGIPVAHEGGLIHNALGDKMYKASIKDATKMAQKALNCKDIQVIRNKNGIPQKQLKVGDACMVFSKGKYAHMTLYIGNGKIAHAQGSSGNVPKNKQIEVRKAYKCQMAIRYIGK